MAGGGGGREGGERDLYGSHAWCVCKWTERASLQNERERRREGERERGRVGGTGREREEERGKETAGSKEVEGRGVAMC